MPKKSTKPVSFKKAIESVDKSLQSINREIDTVGLILDNYKPQNQTEALILRELEGLKRESTLNYVAFMLMVKTIITEKPSSVIALYDLSEENSKQPGQSAYNLKGFFRSNNTTIQKTGFEG